MLTFLGYHVFTFASKPCTALDFIPTMLISNMSLVRTASSSRSRSGSTSSAAAFSRSLSGLQGEARGLTGDKKTSHPRNIPNMMRVHQQYGTPLDSLLYWGHSQSYVTEVVTPFVLLHCIR